MPASTALKSAETASTLARLYRPIARDLEEAERIFNAELTSPVPFIQELVAHLRHYRGKQLRPALLLLTAHACGKITPAHHVFAAVVEMVHTATLVHDDVLDNADLRRHVPTIHARWGNSASVLLGDLLFTHAFYLANSTGHTLACSMIGEATNRVCAGELVQVSQRGNLDLTEAEYFAIIRGKTAELTACCGRVGAAVSGAPEAVIEGMARYGLELGIAFQIADDLLDLVGLEQRVGKSLGTDMDQLKLTLPVIHLLHKAGPERGRHIRQMLQNHDAQRRDRLSGLLEESESAAYAVQKAEAHAAKARQELHCLPASESRHILEELTRLVVHRSA